MKSRIVNHPQLGEIKITMRRDARRFVARWKEGIVHLTIPQQCDTDELMKAIETLTPRLLKSKPTLKYTEGQTIDIAGLKVVISRQSVKPGHVLASLRADTAHIEVGSSIDLDRRESTVTISNILCRIAWKIAPDLLLPRAAELAREIGLQPKSWHIMRGYSTLGKCSSSREIHLSYVIAFLPQELRDYIVWHELAHLSEMSHSPRFHAICDSYCHGREKEYISRLRNHKWQILRK